MALAKGFEPVRTFALDEDVELRATQPEARMAAIKTMARINDQEYETDEEYVRWFEALIAYTPTLEN